jgi:hypothetical protein
MMMRFQTKRMRDCLKATELSYRPISFAPCGIQKIVAGRTVIHGLCHLGGDLIGEVGIVVTGPRSVAKSCDAGHATRLPPATTNTEFECVRRRFVRSIKAGCLSRMIFFGQASLQHAIG